MQITMLRFKKQVLSTLPKGEVSEKLYKLKKNTKFLVNQKKN